MLKLCGKNELCHKYFLLKLMPLLAIYKSAFHCKHSVGTNKHFNESFLSNAKVAYEIRGEICDRRLQGVYRFKGVLRESFKTFMKYINEIRKDELYLHKNKDCHENCRARGCGVSFSVDGLWKIRLEQF